MTRQKNNQHSSNESRSQPNDPTTDTQSASSNKVMKYTVAGLLVILIGLAYLNRDFLSMTALAERETQLKEFQQAQPVLVIGAAFIVYVLVTGLSLPGAAFMTLMMGWYFGFTRGVVLVSFASTAGATMAFLISRYLFRDAVQAKFGDRLKTFNAALEREGAFYLFSLRLIPAVPFFIINVVMGLTPIRARTYWWVSQVGMLAGTAVYCYAGSRVPDLQTLMEKGAGSVFTPSQLTQITVAFVLLGVFPIVVKKLMAFFSHKRSTDAA